MSTSAQQQANKQNAQRSTGPRTDEGKQRSSQNALKHGLCAKNPLIRGEDPDDFYRHGAQLEFQLRPANPVEEDLVEQIIDITWRLKRFARIESGVINEFYDTTAEQLANQGKDEDLIGKALAHHNRLDALSRLSRYEGQLSRRYHSAMKELREARKQRGRSGFFSGLDSQSRAKPQAESSGATDRSPETGAESEMTEPTQSIETLLESIAPMNSPAGKLDLSDLSPADFQRIHEEGPAGIGNPEAQK